MLGPEINITPGLSQTTGSPHSFQSAKALFIGQEKPKWLERNPDTRVRVEPMNQKKAANSPLERGGPYRVGCVTEPESSELVKARLIYLASAVFCGLFAITAIAIHYLGFWPTAAIGALVISVGGWLMVWGIHRELRRNT